LYYSPHDIDRFKSRSFEAPKEREVYQEAKAKLDPSNPENLEELKKLLMRRAMYTIPIILSLQNSGTSVQRLYNRGMLTDDVYENVKEMKAFVDVEFAEVQMEAEDLIKGWGPHIWPEAMRFHQVPSSCRLPCHLTTVPSDDPTTQ
jgi:hypothetical protein